MGPGLCLLLLTLIGTASAPTAADSQTQSPAQTAREWQLPVVDQRTLGVCLHMYLERDFPQIERVVYPAAVASAPRPTSAAAALDARSRVLVDGPGLEANCQQLYRLVRCFSRSLARMQYYEDFSEFRRLVVALDAVLLQLCGTVDLMRHRFLPLLQTLNCIEQVRERASCPYKDRLPPNIWHQLIRLEADSSLCWPMKRQLDCVRDSGGVWRQCGERAQHLFANLSAVFLGHWCLNAAPGATTPAPLLLQALLVLLALLPFLSSPRLPRHSAAA